MPIPDPDEGPVSNAYGLLIHITDLATVGAHVESGLPATVLDVHTMSGLLEVIDRLATEAREFLHEPLSAERKAREAIAETD